MSFQSSKVWGPISAAFYQPGATHSHCRFIHGYGLKFKAIFSCTDLDVRDWVMDFGGLKTFKQHLEAEYDHRLLVRRDDHRKDLLLQMEEAGLCQLTWRSNVGCEAFARHEGLWLQQWLNDQPWNKITSTRYSVRERFECNRVNVFSMEVMEHENNSAIWFHDKGSIR